MHESGSVIWPPPEPGDDFVFRSGISVFFPAYNDARSLPSLLARTFEVLRRHAVDYEVIVVNDGSSDDTGAVLEDLRQEYDPHLRVVTHEQNRGYGGALRSGFAAATKEFVFYTDGDGQYDPGELVALLRKAGPQVGLVNGYKIARQDPWRRIAIGWLYNRFARFLFGVKLRDIDCDFRLIRRSLLDQIDLQSTSGTICVELVRKLELLSPQVVEEPVHHYPRLHGTSQFFRLRSLATTFLQLAGLYLQLRARPAVEGQLARSPVPLVLLATAVLSSLAYARSLSIPFIADDYTQIELGRIFGPVTGWSNLAADALYRCRATSLVLTYWTERLFGLDSPAFNLSSLALHIINSWLVFALGCWRVVGWRVSAIAACYFAVCQQHQEAVIWYAALPELLVFFFAMGSFLLWVKWLQSPNRNGMFYALSLTSFVLALFSKESAVVVIGLIALATLFDNRRDWKRLLWIAPFAGLGALYFLMAFVARKNHLHFNDGTFSLQTNFVLVMLRSAFRLFGIWSLLSFICLLTWRDWKWKTQLAIAGAWIAITFLPYSFLSYMPFVPSRHTYFASAGFAIMVASGFLSFAKHARRNCCVIPAVALMIVGYHCTYLWTKKHNQFMERAAPTERLVEFAKSTPDAVYIRCFPYDKSVARLALEMRVDRRVRPALVFSESEGPTTYAINLCSSSVH